MINHAFLRRMKHISLLFCFFIAHESNNSHVHVHAKDGMTPGVYTIRYVETEDACSQRYLAYNGKRVTMQSSGAKRPKQWVLLPVKGEDGLFTISPFVLDTNYGLSYSKDCSSTSVSLSTSGMKSFVVRVKPGSEPGSFSASISTEDGTCPSNSINCVDSGSSVGVKRVLDSNGGWAWKMDLVETIFPDRTACKFSNNGVTVTCEDTPIGGECILPTGDLLIRRNRELLSLWIDLGNSDEVGIDLHRSRTHSDSHSRCALRSSARCRGRAPQGSPTCRRCL